VKITPRDQEIIDGLKEGLSNRAIADRLGIADRTVKQHLRLLYIRAGIEQGTSYQKRIELLNRVYGVPEKLDWGKLNRLNPRELELALSIVEGKSNQELAARIGKSVQVTKNHLRTVFNKIGCDTRAELRMMVVV
jgi:DNA-binding NarL/FixJ family response regulator